MLRLKKIPGVHIKEREKKYGTESIVTITMENGDVIKAELYPEIAPNTVNNFISLINHNFYDGVIFHRVIKGFMLRAEIRMETEPAVRDMRSKENSQVTDLKTI